MWCNMLSTSTSSVCNQNTTVEIIITVYRKRKKQNTFMTQSITILELLLHIDRGASLVAKNNRYFSLY